MVLLVLIAISAAGVYTYLSWKVDTDRTADLKVQRIPELVPSAQKNQPAYQGAHPATLERPDDPYPYPILVGNIGPYIPLYSGPLRYPFYCRTEESGLGQPLADNQEGIGVPVYAKDNVGRKTSQILGYSKDCLVTTRVKYFYQRIGTDQFFPLYTANSDIEQIDINGERVPFVVRVETGSINRFPYVLAALRGPDGTEQRPDGRYWNQRLIYQFRGGVGIGKVQGRISVPGLLKRRVEQLRSGYAVAYSSANQTSNHYDILLAEETVARVKAQFRALYGKELYTVGIGGSGGAIQQYLLAQNRPGLIDAAIPLYSYPDMITQIQYVFDCELLEFYFDVIASDNPKWRDWQARRLVEGMSAVSDWATSKALLYDFGMLLRSRKPHIFSGSNECVSAWRGLTQLVNNPRYVYHADRYAPRVLQDAHWSYWDDMKHLLGTDDHGFARQTWDNVGVQYGLAALSSGKITIDEFLHLNANIGGWKAPHQMRPERYWKYGGMGGTSRLDGLLKFSPWGHHNMVLSPDKGHTPAKRQQGDITAMQAAYLSGQVFVGNVDIPIIDLRHYLDDQLDMHHSFSSMSARRRILDANGVADNQLIWVTRRPHNPVNEAFEAIDDWMLSRLANVTQTAGESRPAGLQDRCYDDQGVMIAQGKAVWDGEWNGKSTGVCAERYPLYMESRMVAGAPFSGEVFKCHLQSVEQAMSVGLYGSVNMTPYLSRLKQVFPEGVCDFSRGDMARPIGLMDRSQTRPVLNLVPPEDR